jgi:hypothetical protein
LEPLAPAQETRSLSRAYGHHPFDLARRASRDAELRYWANLPRPLPLRAPAVLSHGVRLVAESAARIPLFCFLPFFLGRIDAFRELIARGRSGRIVGPGPHVGASRRVRAGRTES